MTRSKYLTFVAAIVVALCLGVSSAIAQPADQGPTPAKPATANVYVPPADQFAPPRDVRSPDAIDAAAGRLPGALPGPPQWPTNPSPIARTSGDNGDGPWLAIGLALGGVVLLAGTAVGIRRTQRRRTAV